MRMRVAREKQMFTAAFTGAKGAEMAALADLAVVIPSASTARIQEGYMLCAHIMCEVVEQTLFGARVLLMNLMAGRLDAVFLDRDGTINVKAPEGEYITRPEQLRLLPGAGEGIRMLNRAGVPVVVITNQRGIALGRMDEADLAAVHSRLTSCFAITMRVDRRDLPLPTRQGRVRLPQAGHAAAATCAQPRSG